MGLSLYCKDNSWSSTYSGIHLVREWFIKSTIQYIENIEKDKPLSSYESLESFRNVCDFEKRFLSEEDSLGNIEQDKKEILEFLKSLLNDKYEQVPVYKWVQPLRLNYEPWKKTPFLLSYFGLQGLKVFVNHSDCDGYITPGNAYDILGLLSRTGEFLFDKVINEEYEKEWILELIEILKHCIETKHDIIFC